MKLWHYTWSAAGRLVAFPTEASRRAAVRALVRTGGARLVLFAIVDDHVHAAALAEAQGAAWLARSMRLALAARTEAKLGSAFIREVDSRSYQVWLVKYLLDQPRRHGLDASPALWSGSVFQDLVGARVVSGWSPPLEEVLPRWRVREACEHLGLGGEPIVPARPCDLAQFGARHLVAAAAAATCADPALPGRSAEVVLARRAAVELLGAAGHGRGSIADTLGITREGARDLRTRPAPPPVLRAAGIRLALEARVAARSSPPARPPAAG